MYPASAPTDSGDMSEPLACFKESLELLQLEYLDLYLIHWPAKDGPPEEWQKLNSETWRALETLYKDGYVRAIGVSNFWPHHLEPLMDHAEIQPMVLQLEYHPGYTQAGPVAFAKAHGMVMEGWSPLGTGKLLGNETLQEIGKKYSKSPGPGHFELVCKYRRHPSPKVPQRSPDSAEY